MIRYLRMITPVGSPGVRVSLTAGGAVISISRMPGRSDDPTPPATNRVHPFEVVDASSESTAKVRVHFGQVNGITPTIGGVALDHDPAAPPLLAVETGPVYLAVVLGVDGAITSATIRNDTPVPAPDVTHGYLPLASVTVEDGAVVVINQAVTHSLGMRRCGVSDIHFWGL
jgi:hypothetical protein